MPWEPDGSEPIIAPDRVLAYYAEILGCDRADLSLPDTLVATFQQRALDRMVQRIGSAPPARWPTPIFWPLARGSYQGSPLAVARLPIGAPAAAAALELMVAAGVRTVLLVGSAGSLQPHLPVGSLALPTEAFRHEGTSHHYLSSSDTVAAAPALVDALSSAALRRIGAEPARGPTWTTDAPYRECATTVGRMRSAGVLTVEMEAAALYAVGLHRGVRVGMILAISDELGGSWQPGFHTLAYARGLLMAADIALEAASSLQGPAKG